MTRFLECQEDIINTVYNIGHLLCHQRLNDIFSDNEKAKFAFLEYPQNIKEFCNVMLNSDVPQKFQILKQAFEDRCYFYLATTMDRKLNRNEEIGRTYADVLLKTKAFDQYLRVNHSLIRKLESYKLLTESDRQSLLHQMELEGEDAIKYKLVYLLAKRNVTWYTKFVFILWEQKHQGLVKLLLPDLYKELVRSSEESDIQNKINEFFDNLKKEHNRLAPDTLDDLKKTFQEINIESDELILRNYQTELAQPALEGHNVLIVAPTGSGKTHVAVKIALEHLRMDPLNRKVAFLVHRVNLADQQSAVFARYANNKEYNFRVRKLFGGSVWSSIHGKGDVYDSDGSDDSVERSKTRNRKQNLSAETNNTATIRSVKGVVAESHIVVMTAEIFRNALNDEDPDRKINSVNIFSLIIFDEAHNCIKGHPYNMIMEHYFNELYGRNGFVKTSRSHPMIATDATGVRSLPQIVGLTATPGTDKAKDHKSAFKHLVRLHANLDAFRIRMVEYYKSELSAFNNIPEEELLEAKQRFDDHFESKLMNLMGGCEDELKNMSEKDIFKENVKEKVTPPENINRGHAKYTSFVGQLQQLRTLVKNNDKESIFSVTAIIKLLESYVQTLKLNRLFRTQDARNYLQTNLIDTIEKEMASKSSTIKDLLEDLKFSGILQMSIQQDTHNPALDLLKTAILKQIRDIPESRIIVFVRQRLYTQILVDYFKDDWNLRSVPCDLIVGTGNGDDDISSTKSIQREILEKFRDGRKRVLFSTSVTEEGLDVAQCNLVIRYGHVTNEISMIQSKGRARATRSKYLVIVPYGEEWQAKKEQINIEQEKLMFQAIEDFKKLSNEERISKIQECQINTAWRQNEVLKKKRLPTGNNNYSRHQYLVKCRSCLEVVCFSSDIAIYKEMHRVLANPQCLEQCQVVKRDDTAMEIHCSNPLCKNQKLGSVVNCGKQMYPAFGVKYLMMEANDKEKKLFKLNKWNEWDYKPQSITAEVLEQRYFHFQDWMCQ